MENVMLDRNVPGKLMEKCRTTTTSEVSALQWLSNAEHAQIVSDAESDDKDFRSALQWVIQCGD